MRYSLEEGAEESNVSYNFGPKEIS